MVFTRRPGYKFFEDEEEFPDSKEYLAFKEHVLKRLKGIDIDKVEEEGFRLDRLKNVNNRNGYESYDKIIYECAQHIWIAGKIRFSYVSVSVEKKEHGTGNPLELEE